MAKRRSKGEGSIFFWEEKGIWVAKITLPNGKRRAKYGKTQTEVKQWLLTQRNALRSGLLVEDDKILFSDFLARYMDDVAVHTLRPNTVRAYKNIIKYHIIPDLGNIRLTQLRPDHIQAFYSKKIGEGLSKRYVQFFHSVIHKTLQQALKWGLVSRNVADLVDPPSSSRRSFTTWNADQLNYFLESVRNDRWYALYVVATLGFREGEILALHWDEVDLDTEYLQVKYTLIKDEGKLVCAEPKSDSSRRLIKLPVYAVGALLEHRIKQQEIKKLAGERWKENRLVFTTNVGTPISPRNLVKHFKSKTREAGLPEMRFHDLRHTRETPDSKNVRSFCF